MILVLILKKKPIWKNQSNRKSMVKGSSGFSLKIYHNSLFVKEKKIRQALSKRSSFRRLHNIQYTFCA